MLSKFWNSLKSGSDIRGTADVSDDCSEIQLSNEVIEKIVLSFSIWLSKKFNLDYSAMTVAVGHDSRLSSSRIKNVCINTLRGIGISVYDCSLTSTPGIFMSTSVLSCTAAIQITASHLPKDKNGFKFFTGEGGLSSDDIVEILEVAQNYNRLPVNASKGSVREIDIMNYYCEKLKSKLYNSLKKYSDKGQPLEGLKVVVDAGNGAGGFFVDNVLKPMGANTEGSSYLNPDGSFPNHIPNPEDADAMKSIVNITKESNADLGIIFDTDVDRAAFVLKSGKVLEKNKLIALASVIALEENPNSVIVTDSVTSDSLKDFISKKGGHQFRYKRGYNNVIKMAKLINSKGENCPLAIESSGHAAFKENKFIDDGAYLAVKFMVKLVELKSKGKIIEDVINDLVDAEEFSTFKIPIVSKNEDEYASEVLDLLADQFKSDKTFVYDDDNVDGIRVEFVNESSIGWGIIRKSIHEPVLVLYIEGYKKGNTSEILRMLVPMLKEFDGLDVSKINI